MDDSYYSHSGLAPMNPQQDKINRELFVGNTPPGTSELLIQHFLSAAMRRVGLCKPHEAPIVEARLNQKFAFIVLSSKEMADKALNLNGIPFLGVFLKVSRPSKYVGPHVAAKTWQEMTGQVLPEGAALDPEQEKLSRELFIGNTTSEMTESMIRDFLGNSMEQFGLTTMVGNPITACRVSGKFAFIELRSAVEATNALNLNNIPFMGTALRVGRPSKWNGPPDKEGNWEDILAKYVAGEIQLPPHVQQQQALQAQQQQQPTRIVELENMVTEQDLQDDNEYNEILLDTKDECSQFGQLVSVIIPRSGPGVTRVFLEYAAADDAARAVQALQGRTFDGREVQATFYDESKFQAQQYA